MNRAVQPLRQGATEGDGRGRGNGSRNQHAVKNVFRSVLRLSAAANGHRQDRARCLTLHIDGDLAGSAARGKNAKNNQIGVGLVG
jgi:hypothetical protein